MGQKFGPWEDAVTREAYQRIVDIVEAFSSGESEDFFNPEDALQQITAVINETEGTSY